MNGVDPAPQDISLQNSLFKDHKVKVFLYNQQVTDTLTQSFLKQAAKYHVPVVGVYETMPTGYSYQSWMLAEVNALKRAVDHREVDRRSCEPRPLAATRAESSRVRARSAASAWRAHDPRRRQLRARPGRADRPDRFERRRQDDAAASDPRPAGTHARDRHGRRRRWRRSVGYVPQKFLLDPDMPLRGRDLVGARDRRPSSGPAAPVARTPRARCRRCSRRSTPSTSPTRASASSPGGEQQRILIAHALISRPRLLLLDEPLANLDLRSAREVVDLLARIAREQQISVLISAHEMNALLPVMDRVVYLAERPRRLRHGRRGRALGRAQPPLRPSVDVLRVHGRVIVVAGDSDDAEPTHPTIDHGVEVF